MHKINYVHFEGFRRLCDVRIQMRPLMVMIGANGVGKTSFLDAMSLLSASAAGTMNQALSDLGGLAEFCTKGRDKRLALEAEMDCSNFKPLRYRLQLEAKGQSYVVASELLSQERDDNRPEPFKHIESSRDQIVYFDVERGGLFKPDWEHNHQESSLSQVPKMFKQPEEFRRTLSSITQYHVLDVGPRAPVKLPQQLKPASLPGDNGENLIPFLFNLRESNRDVFESIEDTLTAAFPGFESLGFPSPAAGMMTLTWKDEFCREPIYAHQLSEGTLRFLWLVSLLHSPNLPTVTMIDEPEVSLHPELLMLLADLMREASARSQIIVATHSDRLIRFLKPAEVLVMDINEDGHTLTQWADSMDLDKWLADYCLDEVWRMGRMGGRAW